MSIWWIVLIAGIGWLVGPVVLRILGLLVVGLAVVMLVLAPDGTPTITWVLGGLIGVAMVFAGPIWAAHRAEGTCTALGGWVRARAGKAILSRNPDGRMNAWLASHFTWRLPESRRQAVWDEVLAGADQAPAKAASSGSATDDAEHDIFTLTEVFDRVYPVRKNLKTGWQGDSEPWEGGSPEGTMRHEMDRTLEDVRRYLEVIVHKFFSWEVGDDWVRELVKRRRARLGYAGWPAHEEDPPVGCRMLFSVVAEDWPMIGHCFMRDPSEPARTLLRILERYDNEIATGHGQAPTANGEPRGDGLHDDDPELARQAFREILDSIRPQARQRLTDEFAAAVERRQQHPAGVQ